MGERPKPLRIRLRVPRRWWFQCHSIRCLWHCKCFWTLCIRRKGGQQNVQILRRMRSQECFLCNCRGHRTRNDCRVSLPLYLRHITPSLKDIMNIQVGLYYSVLMLNETKQYLLRNTTSIIGSSIDKTSISGCGVSTVRWQLSERNRHPITCDINKGIRTTRKPYGVLFSIDACKV